MLVVADGAGAEPLLEEVSDPPVPAVEPLRVHAVEAVHAVRELLEVALDDEMEVVVEQAVGVEQPPEPVLGIDDPTHDGDAIEVVPDDVLPRDAADGDVERGVVRKERSAATRHASTVARGRVRARASRRFGTEPAQRCATSACSVPRPRHVNTGHVRGTIPTAWLASTRPERTGPRDSPWDIVHDGQVPFRRAKVETAVASRASTCGRRTGVHARAGAVAVAAAAVLAATATAAPRPAAALPKQGELVAGKSLGGIRLGTTAKQVRRTWGGKFAVCRRCRDRTWYFTYRPYQPQGAAVSFRNGRVAAIWTLWSPEGWRTHNRALSLGAPESQATAVLGPLLTVPCGSYSALVRTRGDVTTAYYLFAGKIWGFGLIARTPPRADNGYPALAPPPAARLGSAPTAAESPPRPARRGSATAPGTPPSHRGAAPRRSIAAPATIGPISRPMPLVVVASPAIAPRSRAGISVNSSPQASVITSPPATATGNTRTRYSRIPGLREATREQPACVDERA